jgi:hypothetical protein
VTTVAMERALVSGLGEDAPGIRVIHRDVVPARPWRRHPGWADVTADAVVSALAGGADTIVVARAPEADHGAACVAAVGRLMGHPVITLPEPIDAATWVAALAACWSADGLSRIDRAIAVACGVAGGHGSRPAGMGLDSERVPRVHPRVLGRWAVRAYVSCPRCRCGGLGGSECVGCGEPLPARSVFDAGPGATVVPLRRIA